MNLKVNRDEAMSQARAELPGDNIEDRFAALEKHDELEPAAFRSQGEKGVGSMNEAVGDFIQFDGENRPREGELGLHDFGGIAWQGGTLFAILDRNHLEDLFQLSQKPLPSGHERIAALKSPESPLPSPQVYSGTEVPCNRQDP
jgi:hypothetical protein